MLFDNNLKFTIHNKTIIIKLAVTGQVTEIQIKFEETILKPKTGCPDTLMTAKMFGKSISDEFVNISQWQDISWTNAVARWSKNTRRLNLFCFYGPRLFCAELDGWITLPHKRAINAGNNVLCILFLASHQKGKRFSALHAWLSNLKDSLVAGIRFVPDLSRIN